MKTRIEVLAKIKELELRKLSINTPEDLDKYLLDYSEREIDMLIDILKWTLKTESEEYNCCPKCEHPWPDYKYCMALNQQYTCNACLYTRKSLKVLLRLARYKLAK